MQKSALRILSCFLAMVVLFLSVLPFQAVGTEYVSKESFWNWVASSSNIAQGILSHIPIGSRDNVCANSDDGYHHSNGFIKDGQDGYFRCVCKDCGQEFRGYASDLAPAYDNYVETLPAPGYNSAGRIIWQPSVGDVISFSKYGGRGGAISSHTGFSKLPYDNVDFDGSNIIFSLGKGVNAFCLDFSFAAPISGTYGCLPSNRMLVRTVCDDGSIINTTFTYKVSKYVYRSGGSEFTSECSGCVLSGISNIANSVAITFEEKARKDGSRVLK